MMLRNQYFVPSKKSPFVTVDYLIKVKNKEVFCPRYEQIRLKACPTPPTKTQLLHACCSVQDDYNIDLGLKINGSLPNTQWLLAILSTYDGGNQFFSKSFRPVNVKPERKLINDDGFFDDMPPSLTQSKSIKRSAVIKRLLEPKPPAVNN
jgi:hypothetical protein